MAHGLTQLPDGRKTYELVFQGEHVRFGIYHCAHLNVGRGPEQVSTRHSFNIATHGVYVKHHGHREILVAPGHSVYFNPADTYRTSHPYGFCDEGYYFALDDAFLASVLHEFDPAAGERTGRMFRISDAPLSQSTLLAAHLAFHDLKTCDPRNGDALRAEESALDVARRILTEALGPPRSVPHTLASRRKLAFDAAGLVARRCCEPLSLVTLAAELGTSPFHLSRVFHENHGVTLRDYRDHTRLALALARLRDDPDCDLTKIAFELGFSSHSHFTNRFRRAYTKTPSRYRTDLRAMRART